MLWLSWPKHSHGGALSLWSMETKTRSQRDGTLHSPRFKPDWSPFLQRGAPYVGRLACVRRGDLVRSGRKNVEDFVSDEEATLGQVSK